MAPEGSPGAERPADDVMDVVRGSVVALDGSAPGFRPRCYAELIALVPVVLGSTADHGHAVTDELTGQVFAAALSEDPEGVVADRLGRVGAQLYRAGFPVDGYQGAAHAVLRAARDVYPHDWDSSLSSAWVAYLGWAGDRLARGAAAELARGPATGGTAPAPGAVGPASGPARTVVPASLSEVHAALAAGPFAGNGRALDSVATRIALRTGADIRYPRMDQQTDRALVVTVLGALARMGFTLVGDAGPDAVRPDLPAAVRPAGPVTRPAAPAAPADLGPPPRARWWRRGRDDAAPARPALRPRSRDRVPDRPAAARSSQPAAPTPPPWLPVQPPAGAPARVLASTRTSGPRRTFDAFSRLGDAPAQVPELVTAGGGRAPGTLTEVHERLRTGAFAGNEWALDGVLTRVALRTGADVRAPRPDQVADPAVVREVVTVLERMGYGELSGAEVERPRWWSRGRRRPGPNTLTSTPDR